MHGVNSQQAALSAAKALLLILLRASAPREEGKGLLKFPSRLLWEEVPLWGGAEEISHRELRSGRDRQSKKLFPETNSQLQGFEQQRLV